MSYGRTVLAALLCLVLFTLAGLQGQEGDAVRPVRFSVDLTGEYTDNRDATGDSPNADTRDAGEDIEKEDTFDYTVRPRVDVFRQSEQSRFDLFYAPSVRYRTNPAEDEDDVEVYQAAGLDADRDLSARASARLREKFYYTDDSSIQQGTDLRRDRPYYLNNAELGLLYDLNRKSNFDTRITHMIKRYKDKEWQDIGDEQRYDLGLTYRYLVDRTLNVLALGDVGAFDYADSTFAEAGITRNPETEIDRDFSTTSLGAGLEKLFTDKLRAELSAGWALFTYDDETIDSESSPFAEFSVESSALADTRLTVGTIYQLRDADVYPYASQTALDVFGRADWDFAPRWTLGGSGTYRMGDYKSDYLPDQVETPEPSTAGVFATVPEGEETAVIADAHINFRFQKDTSISLSQRYEDVESDVSTSYTRNSTLLMLSQQF